jgi:hypothetical protein
MPGFSGAGEMIPALAQEASCPGFCRSKTQTRKPERANSNPIAPPITPPPAIATSHFFLLVVLVLTTFTPFVFTAFLPPS